MPKSKKIDHLYHTEDLVKSVLKSVPAKAACGNEKVFTRADFDVTDYFQGCADCMASAAARTRDVISIKTKRSWVELLESVTLELLRPPVSYTYTFTSTAPKSWPS